MLVELIYSLLRDDVNVIIIDTGFPNSTAFHDKVTVIKDHNEPKNISRWWNLGLDEVHRVQQWIDTDYVVAILNDDLVIPPNFVETLAVAIVKNSAAAAYPDQHDFAAGQQIVMRSPGPINLFARMCGYAFALRGSANLKADETLAWWYGDDDLDWRARQAGGNVLVGGLKVQHLRPNESTVGELAEQAGRDRQTFINKWGQAPW